PRPSPSFRPAPFSVYLTVAGAGIRVTSRAASASRYFCMMPSKQARSQAAVVMPLSGDVGVASAPPSDGVDVDPGDASAPLTADPHPDPPAVAPVGPDPRRRGPPPRS